MSEKNYLRIPNMKKYIYIYLPTPYRCHEQNYVRNQFKKNRSCFYLIIIFTLNAYYIKFYITNNWRFIPQQMCIHCALDKIYRLRPVTIQIVKKRNVSLGISLSLPAFLIWQSNESNLKQLCIFIWHILLWKANLRH